MDLERKTVTSLRTDNSRHGPGSRLGVILSEYIYVAQATVKLNPVRLATKLSSQPISLLQLSFTHRTFFLKKSATLLSQENTTFAT